MIYFAGCTSSIPQQVYEGSCAGCYDTNERKVLAGKIALLSRLFKGQVIWWLALICRRKPVATWRRLYL